MTRLLEMLDSSLASPAAGALADRYRGAMVGLAAGNALGIPVEGYPRTFIPRRYPEGIRDIAPQESEREWDDDLAQAVILADSILARDRCDSDDLAARLLAWRRESGRGIGYMTALVLDAHESGVPARDAARQVWGRADRNAAGNGAVMRCAPVALRWRRDPERLVAETIESALVTHHDPRCGWSAVAVNIAVAGALSDRRPDLSVLAGALDEAGAPRAVGEAVRASDGASLDALELDHDNTMGYTLKAMQAGLWALAQPERAESVLLAIVNAGGDADTNAAVAGAMLGAKHGADAWPARWTERIRDRERLESLADRLLERAEQ
jgi:ADP-ribosyl-[dinitrogen reductase] hydrolase